MPKRELLTLKTTQKNKEEDDDIEEDKEPNSENSKDNKKHKIDDEQDFDPLKGHKYELKFEYNATSKRSRRILIWKYDNCNKEFVKTWNIVDHFRIHTKESPFWCKICNKEFTQRGNLRKHMDKHKSESLEHPQKYSCEKCECKYSSQYNLNVHMDREGHSS